MRVGELLDNDKLRELTEEAMQRGVKAAVAKAERDMVTKCFPEREKITALSVAQGNRLIRVDMLATRDGWSGWPTDRGAQWNGWNE